MTEQEQHIYSLRRRARCARHDGLRIGGLDELDRQRVASPSDLAPDPAVPDAPTYPWADWESILSILDSIGLNQRERDMFLQIRDNNRSLESLGLSPHERGAAVREIYRKLRENLEAVRPFVGYLTEEQAEQYENLKKFRSQPNRQRFEWY